MTRLIRWLTRYDLVVRRQVYIPMTELVENSPRCLNMHGRTWERVLTITRQPSTIESRINLTTSMSRLTVTS